MRTTSIIVINKDQIWNEWHKPKCNRCVLWTHPTLNLLLHQCCNCVIAWALSTWDECQYTPISITISTTNFFSPLRLRLRDSLIFYNTLPTTDYSIKEIVDKCSYGIGLRRILLLFSFHEIAFLQFFMRCIGHTGFATHHSPFRWNGTHVRAVFVVTLTHTRIRTHTQQSWRCYSLKWSLRKTALCCGFSSFYDGIKVIRFRLSYVSMTMVRSVFSSSFHEASVNHSLILGLVFHCIALKA